VNRGNIYKVNLSSDQVTLVCLAVAVLGVAALYLYSSSLEPMDVGVSEALAMQPGQYVRISGNAKEISLGASFSSIAVCDPLDSSACISARFSNDIFPQNIWEGDAVIVKGIIREYYNRKYLEVRKEGDIRKT